MTKLKTVIPAKNFPFSNDGFTVQIAQADVPVDIRADLIRDLGAAGLLKPVEATSVERQPSGEGTVQQPQDDGSGDKPTMEGDAAGLPLDEDWRNAHHLARLSRARALDASVKTVAEADAVLEAHFPKA